MTENLNDDKMITQHLKIFSNNIAKHWYKIPINIGTYRNLMVYFNICVVPSMNNLVPFYAW